MYAKLIAYKSFDEKDCEIPVMISHAATVRDEIKCMFLKVDIAKISEDKFNSLSQKQNAKSNGISNQ